MVRHFGTPAFLITKSLSEAYCFDLIVVIKKVLDGIG
jgi:hypothetical protein